MAVPHPIPCLQHDKESNDWRKLQQLLMQLRKCINHPYNFPGAEPDFDGNTSEDIVTASGKMMVLDQLLRKLKEKGHRVVLFSQFNTMLDIIEDYLNMRGYKYRRLDGSTNRVQRRIDISLFNRPGSDTFIYIINTRAGGLGINLQTADTCILYDSDWNPQVDVQVFTKPRKTAPVLPLFPFSPRLLTQLPLRCLAGNGPGSSHRSNQDCPRVPPLQRRHSGGASTTSCRQEAFP